MKIITLTAHRRTNELRAVLDAIEDRGAWKLMLGLDNPSDEVSAMARGDWIERGSWGKEAHQRELVKRAIAVGGEHIACLQDDTIPTEGAIKLLDEYAETLLDHQIGLLSWPRMGLYAGGKIVFEPLPEPGDGVQNVGVAFCADGFVATRACYEKWLLPNWNGPTDYRFEGGRYTGWDWSLLRAMRVHGLVALAPTQSLVRNAGLGLDRLLDHGPGRR